MKWLEMTLVFLLIGVMTLAGNSIGYHFPLQEAAIGYLFILVVTLGGMGLSHVMPFKLPMVFWVSVLALAATSPVSPVAATVIHYTGKVEFLALTTPILAYAGLSIGKDLAMFRKMSWRIIVVAVAVYTGTFVCSTAIAQVMLHLEGII